MTWFLVETTDTAEFVSKHDPDKDNPTKWVIHPPEPYAAARLTAQQANKVDVDDLDPNAENFSAEYLKRAMKMAPEVSVDSAYEWTLLGLSEIRPHGEDPITEITMDLLRNVHHAIIKELGDKIANMAGVDQETEKN